MSIAIVKNWRVVYKHHSLQALTFIGLVQGIAFGFPAATLAGHVPFTGGLTWQDLVTTFTILGAILGALGKYIDQGPGVK